MTRHLMLKMILRTNSFTLKSLLLICKLLMSIFLTLQIPALIIINKSKKVLEEQ
jgi:hypothetical protein